MDLMWLCIFLMPSVNSVAFDLFIGMPDKENLGNSLGSMTRHLNKV